MILKHLPSLRRLLVCAGFVVSVSISLCAQTQDEIEKAKATAILLIDREQYSEAVPYLETAIKGTPTDPQVRFLYGFSLLAKAKQTSNVTEAKLFSAKALEQFNEAKRLGLKEEANETLISMLSGEPAENGGGPIYSSNPEAEKAMNQAEAFFAQSNYDEAIKLFEKALALDAKIYQAAIGGGDSSVAKGEWDAAEKWYQRAIAIDPNRETAFRYSGTPFMRQKKYDQARDRYIEAFIVEPYNRMSLRGISQWSQVTGKRLAHPAINVPNLTFDAKGKALPDSPIDPKDPANDPWIAYISVREAWKNGKFAAANPKAAGYRHSVAEEVEALQAAVNIANSRKLMASQFETLAKMDKEGLLEAYVLLALPDEGIADDHTEYLKNNRAKLKQYVTTYLIQP